MRLAEIHRVSADAASEGTIRDNIRAGLSVPRKPFCKIDDVAVSMGEDGREQFFIFARDRMAMGAAILHRATLGGENGFYVTEIGLLDALRYQGIGMAFYRVLLDRGYTLFSGGTQTSDGERTWRKLLAEPGLQIRTIRITEDGDEPADEDAWSEPDLRLIARKG